MLIIAFGRYAQTENLIDQAARDAARAATAQNERAKVEPIVQGVVSDSMVNAPPSCRPSAQTEPPQLSSGASRVPDANNPDAIESVNATVTRSLDLRDVTTLP